MSCPNYRTMENFPLMVQEYTPESYDNDDYCEEMENARIFYEDILEGYDGFLSVMEDFNEELRFYELDFSSGYFDGIQILVSEIDCYEMYDTKRWNKKLYREECLIRRFLNNISTQYGWRKLNCLAVLSNGEAVYQYAA